MPSVERSLAIVRLVRLQNGIIAALGVLAGAWWASGRLTSARTLLAAVSAIFLAAFANAFNDWCDVDIDQAAHPRRPLPRGDLTTATALRVAATAAVLGLVGSALAWPALAFATLVVLLSMFLYSMRVKRAGAPGNVLVAILASLPFLYGAWSVGQPRAAAALLAISIPLHLAREVAKDLDDARADAALRHTLPVVHGASVARI